MTTLERAALALTLIGGLNWGLVGLFRFDLVAALFGGSGAAISRIVYTLVGVGALILLPRLLGRATMTRA